MSAELHTDDEAIRPPGTREPVLGTEPPDHGRPTRSGDLSAVFRAAPMFRRCVAGYDRFQVETYVQWAEEELATAEREHEHLLTRLLRTRAAFEEARQLLAHSSEGGQLLRSSRRIGAMLAAAADEAESMRAEARADRTAAGAHAQQIVEHADRVLADAQVRADRMVAAAATEIEEATVAAALLVDEAEHAAERTVREARAEAEARLAEVRRIEQLAGEHAERTRQQALAEESAVRLRARDEVVRMLVTGRDERRRADAEAAAARERLDGEAAARRALLLTGLEELERRRAALLADPEVPPEPSGNVHLPVLRYVEQIPGRLTAVFRWLVG
jgi:hypothetical protein